MEVPVISFRFINPVVDAFIKDFLIRKGSSPGRREEGFGGGGIEGDGDDGGGEGGAVEGG